MIKLSELMRPAPISPVSLSAISVRSFYSVGQKVKYVMPNLLPFFDAAHEKYFH